MGIKLANSILDNFFGDDTPVTLGSTTPLSASNSFTPATSTPADPLGDAVMRASMFNKSFDKEGREKEGEGMSTANKARAGILAANFVTDIMNANTAYSVISQTSQMNLMMSKANQEDAMYRGRQNVMDTQAQGNRTVEEVQANFAAQGIDLNSVGAKAAVAGYKAMSARNAATAEMNMYREAFKYEAEQIQLELKEDIAYHNRNLQVLNSFSNTAASAAFSIFK